MYTPKIADKNVLVDRRVLVQAIEVAGFKVLKPNLDFLLRMSDI